MRVGMIMICSILLLTLVNGSVIKCSKCTRNECACKRKILKASVLPPPDFESIKQCEETKPTDMDPIEDSCSRLGVALVRPYPPEEDIPIFAPSTSCECGYEERKPDPKQYPADPISQYLADLAARKKTIPETDLHFHGPPIKVWLDPKPVKTIPEELLHKLNRQPIELKPPKKNYDPRVEALEEEQDPCQPEKQYYSDICYGKIESQDPTFEKMDPEEVPSQTYSEEPATECPTIPETEEECDTEEETAEDPEEEEEDGDSCEGSEDCESFEEDEVKK